jgi:hypothetical protein
MLKMAAPLSGLETPYPGTRSLILSPRLLHRPNGAGT